jgi:hypothetical protein
MDPDVIRIAQVFAVVGVFGICAVAVILGAIFLVRRGSRGGRLSLNSTPQIDEARFTRLEQAVDSIALEVERMTEAQRFTVKLMTERAPERIPEKSGDK